MRIVVIFLLLISNAANAKVYKIKLESDDWIKVVPHVYYEADWRGYEWGCGSFSTIYTTESDWRKDSKNLMGFKLNEENKKKHINLFNKFLRNYINQKNSVNDPPCPNGDYDDLETWIDYKNKIIGMFKVISYDRRGWNTNCMIYQTLIQVKKNIRTRISGVCYNHYSYNYHYDFQTLPRYLKIDVDSFKRLNK